MAQALLEVTRQRRLNQNRIVQLLDVRGNAENRECLEPAQRVASLQELSCVALVQGPRDKQRDVIDHVAVGEELEESGRRTGGLGEQVTKFSYELVGHFASERRGRGVWGQGGEEVAVCRSQLELDICAS